MAYNSETVFVLRLEGLEPQSAVLAARLRQAFAVELQAASMQWTAEELPGDLETWHTLQNPPKVWMLFQCVERAGSLHRANAVFRRCTRRDFYYHIDDAVAAVADVCRGLHWVVERVFSRAV